MDKKTKKRIGVLQKKLTKLRNELSVVKKFTDDPEEIPQLEGRIAEMDAELKTLKGG